MLYGQAGWRRSFFVGQQQVFVVEDVRRDLVQASSGGGDMQYAAAPWIQLPQIGVRQQVLRHLLEASALGGKVQQVPACRRTFVPQVLLRQKPGGDLFEETVQGRAAHWEVAGPAGVSEHQLLCEHVLWQLVDAAGGGRHMRNRTPTLVLQAKVLAQQRPRY